MKIEKYATDCNRKYYLKAHLIFVCKYRKKLLQNGIDTAIKNKFKSISNASDFDIDVMETDQDHIHLLVDYKPDNSITSIIRKLKQESTFWIWKAHGNYLSKHFCKEHTFWSDGYFACSIGEASPETIRKYIENQG